MEFLSEFILALICFFIGVELVNSLWVFGRIIYESWWDHKMLGKKVSDEK